MTLLAQLSKEVFAVEVNYAESALQGLKKLEAGVRHENIAQPDRVTYQEVGNVAVIAIDGAMYKKRLSGLCSSVIGYEQIKAYIAKAEENSKIDTILFRVDTPGGAVAGADEVRDAIKNSSKKTIVYAENLLASAGMWIFSAADEIYSNETTALGSIGVLVTYEDREKGAKYLVSSNAPNKVCNIKDETCKSKIQARLDEYEAIFYSRLVESFGKDKETIKADFDSGATIMAINAHKKRYIKELLPFDALLERLTKEPLAAMPPERKNSKSTKKELAMTQEELQAQLDKANATIEDLQSKIGGLEAELKDSVTAQIEKAKAVIVIGAKFGASADAMLTALEQDTIEAAENVVLKAVAEEKESGGVLAGGEKQLNKEDKELVSDEEMKQIVEEI